MSSISRAGRALAAGLFLATAGAPAARAAAVEEWRRWLADYRANQ